MLPRLSRADLNHVLNAAKIMDSEAQTWKEGFAHEENGTLTWDKNLAFAQVHFVKLKASSAKLRSIIQRASLEPEYYL